MIVSLIVAALIQAAPVQSSEPPDNGLPKDDYGLVAWCHGALAGQLELDTLAQADMAKIEGKEKAAGHAKADAEMEKERRQYLKDYEHALAAAEAASPTMIHAKGVAAEQQGYRMWAATRNKEPIWRMLDWGMWDPNDAGCGDAAKRLQEKASLFGEALKRGPEAPAKDQTPALAALDTEAKAAEAEANPDQPAPPTAAADLAPPTPQPSATAAGLPAERAKPKARAKTQAKAKRKSAEEVRAALATAPAADPAPASVTAPPEPTPASTPAPTAPPGLRGPQ